MTQPENTPDLPETLPLFTASGAILLPKSHISLNIYEPHFQTMIDDALGEGRLVGVLQPTTDDEKIPRPPLFHVGTVGKIVTFSETEDGRYLVDLLGLCRFAVKKEVRTRIGYRRIVPDWHEYLDDINEGENSDFDRTRLTTILRSYFKTHGVVADWNVIQNTTSEELISSLAMICPLEPNEKQALVEAPTFLARVELLITLLEMATLRQNDGETARH